MGYKLISVPYKGREYTLHMPGVGTYGTVGYSLPLGGWVARIDGDAPLLDADGWARTFETKHDAAQALVRAVEL